ncbi:putative NAD/FAD-binding protein [Kitasatospora sp. MAP12-15]|uniref:NAD(P)/FAD-dependent oxidoreductase n=1 Tax=unclassified Kitasatospora TaxID=2633591 RepID=UPI00247626D5|nr:FAD-dependent oxidoreductase [Kitasatospora sp. MAP12-44]MDH6111063.1 putative NAD/FAD-binding protein [Kitasatospora sp. MAP12-44]
MSTRVAVIGAGISGLSAAYHLPPDVEVTVYEKEDRPGGHANTVEVVEGDRTIGIDTAFVVFNSRTYPQISGFFQELGATALDHTGGFNFFDLDRGLDYGTAEFELSEAEITERYPADFLTLWRDAERFHREAPRDFLRKRTDLPLGEYLDRGGYSDAFRYGYVVLLATAVWSVPAELIWEMPATTVIAFFMSHDPGGLGGRTVSWKTVAGGSVNYVRRVVEAINGKVRTGAPVTGVREDADAVVVSTADGHESYDYAIVATHADQTLGLLERPTARQATILEKVRYSSTSAILHRDPATMSPDRARWESWNYGLKTVDGTTRTWVAYYMNALQGFTAEHDYFVTLDSPIVPRDDLVIRELPYTHPIIDMDVRAMQKDIHSVNDTGRIKLAGSYFHSPKIGPDLIGSHESGFVSGLRAAAAVGRDIDRSTAG